MGKKTLSFKGNLGDLLKEQNIIFSKIKTETEGIFTFHFKSSYGISYSLKILIDQEFVFDLWINSSLNCLSCFMDSFMKLDIPNDRLKNLIALIENRELA